MKKFFHPSAAKLTAWLEGKSDEKLEAHIADCDHCATTIERIAEELESPELSAALTTVLNPTEEVTYRVAEAVQTKLESREVLELVSGLFIAGVETSKILVTEDL